VSLKQLFVPLAAIALIAAAPRPTPSTAPSERTLSVVCSRAHLYVFVNGSDRPTRAHTFDAMLGQRFGLVSGPRTTLGGDQYYETDIVVIEPGYGPNAHYWINRSCAIPSK